MKQALTAILLLLLMGCNSGKSEPKESKDAYSTSLSKQADEEMARIFAPIDNQSGPKVLWTPEERAMHAIHGDYERVRDDWSITIFSTGEIFECNWKLPVLQQSHNLLGRLRWVDARHFEFTPTNGKPERVDFLTSKYFLSVVFIEHPLNTLIKIDKEIVGQEYVEEFWDSNY